MTNEQYVSDVIH